jgi:small subunit ribosomal protein S1
MQENEIVNATISAVHEYGLDLDLDGQPGFVQPNEISWTNAKQSTDFTVGDRVPVLIYAITPDRFFASIKRAAPQDDPWVDPSRFSRGTRHMGTVRNVVDWGCKVEIAPGVFAMILGSKHRADFEPGSQLDVEVIDVDAGLRKVEVKPI